MFLEGGNELALDELSYQSFFVTIAFFWSGSFILSRWLLGKDLLEELGTAHFRLLVLGDREVALNAYLVALCLEQTPETGVVYAVAFDNGNGCGLAIPYPDGRIVLADVGKGRAL